jgi:hypothetical protein
MVFRWETLYPKQAKMEREGALLLHASVHDLLAQHCFLRSWNWRLCLPGGARNGFETA